MPGKHGFGNSRKKSPFKLKGMDFGTGTGSSPLNKNGENEPGKGRSWDNPTGDHIDKQKLHYKKSMSHGDVEGGGHNINRPHTSRNLNPSDEPKRYGEQLPAKKSPLNRRSADERIAKAVEKGNVKKAARISARQAKKGKTKVAPTSTPVNDASMKNYNKAVDARTKKKEDKKSEIKDKSNKLQEKLKPQANKSKVVAKPVVKKTIEKVPTKRSTGVTYKSAWDADKGGVKSKYKDYASFEKAAKDYNRSKDSSKKYNMPPKEASEYQKRQANRALNQRK